jgi:hypothetical protein
MDREPLYYFVFQEKSAFIPLRYIYPECSILIESHPKVEPLQCFCTSCPANQSCAEIIVKKVHYLFTHLFPKVEMLFIYFRFKDGGFYSQGEWIPSLGALVCDKDLNEPKWMKINRWGFNKCKTEGITMMWMPTDEYLFMSPSSDIIVPENHLVKLYDD